MIRLVQFEPWHQKMLKLKACYDNEKIGPVRSGVDAITMMREGVPIAVFGGYQIVPKTMQVWALISDDVRKCSIEFHKAVLKLCQRVENLHSLNRIQASVRMEEIENIRWAKSLGFDSEAIMKKYGSDGSDYMLLARIVE